MDDEATKLLREILDQQVKQTELLQKHLPPLWMRVRFSLMALLVLMTLVAVGLGFGLAGIRSLVNGSMPMPPPIAQPMIPAQGQPGMQAGTDDLFGTTATPSQTAEQPK